MNNSPKTTSDAAWDAACDFHVGRVLAQAEAGRSEAAGRHAAAIVHMAVTRRAMELKKILRLGWFSDAEAIAKAELFDVTVGVLGATPVGSECASGAAAARQIA